MIGRSLQLSISGYFWRVAKRMCSVFRNALLLPHLPILTFLRKFIGSTAKQARNRYQSD